MGKRVDISDKYQMIYQLKLTGKTNQEIANILGIGKSTYQRKIKELNWNFPQPNVTNFEDYIGQKINKLTLIKILPESKNNFKYGLFKCDCGKEIEVRLNNWKSGNTKSCGCHKKEVQKEFQRNLKGLKLGPGSKKYNNRKDLTNQTNGYLTALYPTEEVGSGLSIIWACKCDAPCENCPTNHFHKVEAKRFSKTRACKFCTIKFSHGANEIREILIKNNIKFELEKYFSDCKDQKPLPFDFYLPDYNTLIEFDGEQHYKPVSNFGGEEKFKVQVLHDKIKNEYCLKNNIHLIRIPYIMLGKIQLKDLLPQTSRFLNYIG